MTTSRASFVVAQSNKVAERLLAHARLCRQIAEQSWSEQAAHELEVIAQECTRAAGELTPDEPEKVRH